jgi:FAD/FMN-containing dehydrogenase
MSTLNQGMTCLPGDASIIGHNCTLGGYPVYVVDARNARDIQAAVNFARNMNIRLVIKNTGHDFHGKASGFGSLSIRTHALKDIAVIKNYRSKKYTGPAIKAGSGVQGFELYQAASDAGLMVVGGEGMTVGWGGGYIQGGGHSPLSSIHGMAADQVLSYEVVLANGRFVTADADTNPDLFWAMRGGGGSTFGVLVSITVKAFPDVPVTVSTFTFDPSAADVAKYALADTSNDDFWAVVKEYFSQFAIHAGQGIYSYFNIFPSAVAGSQTFTMIPFFAPNKTAGEVDALLASTVAKAKEHNITLVPKTVTYSGFHAAWKAGFPKETIGMWNVQSGSRLFPRENWENIDKFEMQFNAIREVTMNSYMLGFNIAPTLANGQVTADETAVLPAWRETMMHAITGTMWDTTIRDLSVVRSIQKVFTDGNMKKWRDVSPGSGAYLAECDFNEPDHQTAFWGANYPKLYQMKQKYDPRGVFFAETAVGSEDWSAGVDRIGRLCPV